MSSPSALPDPVKIQKFREHLHEEWTGEQTVAAWRKWHAQIAVFSRGGTEAILEAAQLRPGMRVLDLASGVGDPALSLAAAVGPSGRVTATDLGPGMTDASYDALTCRFGAMFFPDLGKALRECLRVLKPGGRAAFVVWGKGDQPFFATTAGIVLKHLPVPPPPPDPDGPSMFMFGERGRFRRALESVGFSTVSEEACTVPGSWPGPPEEFWEQFTEVAAPFRPLIAQLTPEKKAIAVAEILAGLRKYWDGKRTALPLEIVVASGIRPT